jgi:Patatin-like phospholipase
MTTASLRVLVSFLVALSLASCRTRECAEPPPGTVPPPAEETWVLQSGKPLAASLRECVELRGAALNVLALSGGGQKGAFGAGFLKGWSAQGNRPVFDIVTGISTGALIATFAFLGPTFDDQLEHVYTETPRRDIVKDRGALSAAFSSSLSSLKPLEKLIAKYIDENVIAAVAAAYDAGRRLYVGTVNLDAGRLQVWDLTELARRRGAAGLELYRKVLLASASTPVQFAPVMIDGAMHVDGGVREQIFVVGVVRQLCLAMRTESPGVAAAPAPAPATLYLLVNSKIGVEPTCVNDRIGAIGLRAIDVVVDSALLGGLFKIYALALFHGLDYRLVDIPESSRTHGPDDPFDQTVMRELFAAGFDLGREPDPWQRRPPESEEFEGLIAPRK